MHLISLQACGVPSLLREGVLYVSQMHFNAVTCVFGGFHDGQCHGRERERETEIDSVLFPFAIRKELVPHKLGHIDA